MGALAAASARRDENDMTLDDLYGALRFLHEAVEFGFKNANLRIDEHFDSLGTRLELVDQHIQRLETRIEDVEKKLEGLRTDVASLTARRR
jgi:chromosome segregation ATPase